MNVRPKVILIVGMLFAVAAWTVAADNISNQATQMTFEQSVRIPGHVLPAGTYWFKVLDSGSTGSDPNKVQVTNADGTKTIAELITQTADHAQFGQEAKQGDVHWPSGKVIITVAAGRSNEPVTLLTWYYPGRTDGHRFVYPDREQKQIDEEMHHTLSFNPGDKVTIGKSLAALE